MSFDLAAVLTALPALLVAVAAFWQTIKGNADHASNADRISALEASPTEKAMGDSYYSNLGLPTKPPDIEGY